MSEQPITFMGDQTLSYEERGMLGYILTKPDGWHVTIDDLIVKGCKRDKAYRILKLLIDKGYIIRQQYRVNGKFEHIEYVPAVSLTQEGAE